MKNLIIFTLSLFFFTTFLTLSLNAQSSDRFDRDIRIAEGIIEELFGADESPRPYVNRYVRNVSGQYIPGYGIHFTIDANNSPAFIELIREGQISIDVNYDDEADSNANRVSSREFVEERFMEYLKTYAPLFDELPDNEVIRLTFGQYSNAAVAFILRSGSSDNREPVAYITAWASTSHIRAFDENSISSSEFESRVEVVNLANLETERDQTVFASILQTSLEDVSDTIRVRRAPATEYLPGLGLSYTINANVRTGGWFDFGDIQIDDFRIETDSLSIEISNMLEEIDMSKMERLAERIDSITGLSSTEFDASELRRSAEEARVRIVERQREVLSDEDVNQLVDRFHEALVQTVQDYGPTLRSLNNDEMLLITINWAGRHSALPGRTELRIQKSDILDGGEPVLEVVNRRSS